MESLAHYVETLSLLGDESRLRLCALLRERELCVSDLVRVTGIAQSRVSTHLGRLREAGLVCDRRQGAQSFYTLVTDGIPDAARALLTEAISADDYTLQGDRQRLLELDAERRGDSPESTVEIELDYSPGRTWHSLALGLAGLLKLGDVLDIGSGDGAAASSIAPYCKSLTCVDVNPRLVAAAAARLSKFPSAKATVGDAHALPFPPESFDAVLIFHTLTYAEQPRRVLEEAGRVLRRGGRLVVLCLDEHEQLEVTTRYGERHPGFSPGKLRRWLARMGLSVLTAEVACREAKKPHLQVVLTIAEKPANVS